MSIEDHRPSPPGPGHTVPDMSGQWLTVADAVQFCAEMGLNRDIKTIRRWAQRSHSRPENAEVLVHEQDTPTGFRYVIEQSSLERKIAQELAFEASRAEADTSGQVLPGPGAPAPVPPPETASPPKQTGPDTPEPAHPSPDTSPDEENAETRKLTVSSVTDTFLKDQIAEKDAQIRELNRQIERRDGQMEAMLERDKETNILINTLQELFSQAIGIESPARMQLRSRQPGDSSASSDQGDEV
ncbi:MAG: hypothetical protein AAGF48_15535 [Pseudomonadota bacterium]